MAKTYEQKLAEKKARADARKAVNRWHESGLGIDRILKDMGYEEENHSIYVFRQICWTGMDRYEIKIDTFGLLHEELGKLKTTVKKF